jgi:signal transduction histidine kinase
LRWNAGVRLADFILRDMPRILEEWEAFAASLLPAASGLTSSVLRDHAPQILEAIARDLTTFQSRHEQSEKSKGRAPRIEGAPETAAQTHAVLRARSGFDLNQLVAEYRALRASVLRLWMDAVPFDETAVEDMIRFNEAIDQAISESVAHFHGLVESYRNLLLGMLGHDMRNPLNSILLTAQYLGRLNAGDEVSEAAGYLIRSGASMQALLDDLTDFNRTNLGLGLRIVPADVDLAQAAGDELEQFRAAHPKRRFELSVRGDTRGRWDGARVQQMLRNLLSNALRYGSPDLPIRVTLDGGPPELRLEVHNSGRVDPAELRALYDPLRRGSVGQKSRDSRDGLGLGLFIVHEIARAHGGEVEASCEGDRTTFSVRLPRPEALPRD